MIGVGTFTVNDRMRELVGQVLDSGRISYGPMCRELEQRFAALHGCKFGILSNSGTSSLQVTLQAMKELYGWRDGDEIITQSVTFVATVNVILHNRLKPVLVDIDDCYGLDPRKLEEAITKRTRAVIPVHLFGQPCDMTNLQAISQRHHLKVIEDSCETMFVLHRGHPAGSWGDAACFSMYVAHLLTAGVGGLTTTNDPELAVKVRSLVNHGRDGIYLSIDDDDGIEGKERREIIDRRFRFESVGHSYRITELEAALALGQLDDWRQMIHKRQENAAYICSHLSNLDWIHLPRQRRQTGHAFMMLPLVCDTDKSALCAYLEGCGVETREMLPLTNQPVYKGLWNPVDYPNAERVNEKGFYVGCHQDLTRPDLDWIVDSLRGWRP